MKNYLQIGEVCNLYDISLDTLRHYDRIGLLKPAVVKENGYRYYSLHQLDVLEIILIGKELNMPLSLIKPVLESNNMKSFLSFIQKQQAEIRRQKEKLNILEKKANSLILSLTEADKYPDIIGAGETQNIDIIIYCPNKLKDVVIHSLSDIDEWEILTFKKDMPFDRESIQFGISLPKENSESVAISNMDSTEKVQLSGQFTKFVCHGKRNALIDCIYDYAASLDYDATFYIHYTFSLTIDKTDSEHFVEIYMKNP